MSSVEINVVGPDGSVDVSTEGGANATIEVQGEVGPTGATGAKGDAATVTVGSTTTSAAGGAASVVNSGTTAAAILDFTIPRGETGPKGDPGDVSASLPNDFTAAQTFSATVTVNADLLGTFVLAKARQHAQTAYYDASVASFTTGTFADARVAETNVTQHQASLSIATTQLTGTLPDARVAASNVTQHQAALSIAATQVTGAFAKAQQHAQTAYYDATSPAFTGTLAWGGGAAITSSDDVATVGVQNVFTEAQVVRLPSGSATTDDAIKLTIAGDSVTRVTIDVDGRIEWGTGSDLRDTNLYRSAANTLKTDDTFVVGDTLSVAGAVTASSYIQGPTSLGYLDLRGDSGATSGVRLNDAGNLGLGTTDIEAWHSNYRAIEFGSSAIMAHAGSYVGAWWFANAYYDGAFKYKHTAAASNYKQVEGAHYFQVAPSGTADTVISWTTALTISTTGLQSFPTHYTTANAANMFINSSNGAIYRSTSSVRYKKVLREMSLADARAVVNGADPMIYTSLADAEAGEGREFVGMTAERFHEVDARFVHYNEDGQPEGLMYERMVVPLTVIARNHESRIAALEAARSN